MSLTSAKAVAILSLLTFLLYARAIGYGFVDYDDQRILLGQPHLFQVPFWDGLIGIFTYLPREEPLLIRDLSWLIDSHLFGFENPLGYHLVNVLLNALNTALLYLALEGTTKRPARAFVIAALFAIAPVHVEPVCWIMGRKDLLSATFMLLALVVQNRALDRDSRWLHLVILLLVVLATLSKINAAVFFVVLFLHRVLRPHLAGDAPPSAPIDRSRVVASALAIAPHALVSIAILFWYQTQLARYGLFGRGPPSLSLQHLATLATFVPVVLLENAKLLVVPTNLQLFYDFPAIGRPFAWYQLALAYGFTVLLGTALFYTLRRRKDLFFYLATACVLCALYLNLVYIGIWIANRYLYLISFCVIAAGVTLAADHLRRRLAIAIGAAYALFSLAQITVALSPWEDNRSLWEHEIALPEPSMLAFSGMARVQVQQAETSRDPEARRAALSAAKETLERGIVHYRSLAIEPVPGYVSYQHQYYGKLLHFRARTLALDGAPLDEQLTYYVEAHRTEPTSPLNNMSLAEIYFKLAFTAPSDSRSQLATKSLSYFERYAQSAVKDAAERRNVAHMLEENYASRFPELVDEVARIRTALGLE